MKNLLGVVVVAFLLSVPVVPQRSDAALRAVTQKDKGSRGGDGRLQTLTAAEHLSRGQTYLENRMFPQAREQFQKVLENYPEPEGIPERNITLANEKGLELMRELWRSCF